MMLPIDTLIHLHTLCSYAAKPGVLALRTNAQSGMNLSKWPFAAPPSIALMSGPNAYSWNLLDSKYI